jgi:hypothetical protein
VNILAEATNYDELIGAFRARMHSLNTPMEIIDEVAGLPTRYTSKIFAPARLKTVGRVSLGPLLGALGLRLLVAVDEEAFAKVQHRLVPRKNTRGEIRAIRDRRSALLGNGAWGRMMQARWMLSTSSRQRKAWARQAIRARWARAT